MQETEIYYRLICENDFKALQLLFAEFAAFENCSDKMTNTLEQMLEEKELLQGIVATKQSKIIGYVTYFHAYYTWSGKSLYMEDLYVLPEYRSQGIGTELTRQLIEVAKNTKCKRMRWQVSNWNSPAINFYKSLGAQINDTEMNCDLYFNK